MTSSPLLQTAMLQPGDAEEAEGDDDAQSEDAAISDEGYGPPNASGPYPEPTPKNPCAESHKKLFYLNDFSYLEDPNYHGHCFGDSLKLMPLGVYRDWGTLDIGGQQRLQYKHEIGMGNAASGPGQLRFEDTEFDMALTRTRLYGKWKAPFATFPPSRWAKKSAKPTAPLERVSVSCSVILSPSPRSG